MVGAAHALGVRLRRELNAAGFPVRQAHGYVLRALHARPLSLTALAELLGVTKQAAGQVVDEMVERGLVERRPDPHDRRAKLLAIIEAEGLRRTPCSGVLGPRFGQALGT